jgi:hypothetical protein
MSIWCYEHMRTDRKGIRAAMASTVCLYCSTPLTAIYAEDENEEHLTDPSDHHLTFRSTVVRACSTCGWWSIVDAIRTELLASVSHIPKIL